MSLPKPTLGRRSRQKWIKIHFHSYSLWLYLVIQSCLTLCDPMDYSPPGSSVHDPGSPGKNTGGGRHFLFQRIVPIQGPNLHLLRLLHFKQILYHWATREAPHRYRGRTSPLILQLPMETKSRLFQQERRKKNRFRPVPNRDPPSNHPNPGLLILDN